MITPIEYEEIPEITFEGRKIKEYIATVKPIEKNKKINHYVFSDYDIKFYLETTNHELTLEDAYEIYNKDRKMYLSFDEVIDMEIETIECGTYIDDQMRAGWAYFHQ
jgi:hypothetical protein